MNRHLMMDRRAWASVTLLLLTIPPCPSPTTFPSFPRYHLPACPFPFACYMPTCPLACHTTPHTHAPSSSLPHPHIAPFHPLPPHHHHHHTATPHLPHHHPHHHTLPPHLLYHACLPPLPCVVPLPYFYLVYHVCALCPTFSLNYTPSYLILILLCLSLSSFREDILHRTGDCWWRHVIFNLGRLDKPVNCVCC